MNVFLQLPRLVLVYWVCGVSKEVVWLTAWIWIWCNVEEEQATFQSCAKIYYAFLLLSYHLSSCWGCQKRIKTTTGLGIPFPIPNCQERKETMCLRQSWANSSSTIHSISRTKQKYILVSKQHKLHCILHSAQRYCLKSKQNPPWKKNKNINIS